METLKQQKKILIKFSVFLVILLASYYSDAQTELIISDNGKISVSSGTFFKIPGNITVGGGTSGTLKINGTNTTVNGQLNLNAGSNLFLTNENLSVGTVNINTSSTVTYDGTDQNIFNWSYGNMVLSGSGNMNVTGDVANPTICNNLTVNNTGNILRISETKAITVNNILSNNAGVSGISIESSVSGDGSLISFTSAVSATVKRYLTGNRWHYIASPIDGAPLTLFNTNNFMLWDASMDWSGTGDYNPWQGYTSSNLINAQGYAYYYYETTIPFQGNINVADYSVNLQMYNSGNLDYQGWNLVGNPYTSVLDWDAAVSGGAVPTGAENAIYYFDDDDASGSQNNYRYYVPSSGGTYGIGTEDANGKIPMGQGFFIKTNTDNVILSLSKNYRTHANQEFYKSNTDEYFKLKIANNNKYDETVVRIVENSTTGFDSKFDARKLFPFDNSIPQVFIVGSDYKITAINSIPDIKPATIIKLGIKAEKGEYDIRLSDLNFFRYDIFLVDNETNSIINLNEEDSYHFNYEGEQNENRFRLIFQSPASEVSSDVFPQISIYPNPTSQFIKFSNNSVLKFNSVKINSVNGKNCYLNNHPETLSEIDISGFSNGVYFIEIKLSNGEIYRNKIILQK